MTMSYLTQMLGIGGTKISCPPPPALLLPSRSCAAFRDMSPQRSAAFAHDVIRITLWVLLPMCLTYAHFLVSQGVIQNMSDYLTVTTLAGDSQSIAMGPVASQEAVKLLGTNGGGFFNVNSAHPFENPTP